MFTFISLHKKIIMRNKITLLILFVSLLISFTISAQTAVIDTGKMKPPIQKFYLGTAFDGGIFSSATIKEDEAGVMTNKLGIIRFSYVLNFGVTFNYNYNRHLGAYAGIDVKNIGFIEKNADAATVKRRTYNLGVPLGVKAGNMAAKRAYIFLGGGADLPFNYREKTFIIRDQKTKFSEWFSDRTPSIMPYVFAGAAVTQGFTIKVQYYPNNFFNPDFTTNGSQPYASYDVHLILVSIGLTVPLSKRHDIVTKQVSGLNIM
jgi:hypothetical protein